MEIITADMADLNIILENDKHIKEEELINLLNLKRVYMVIDGDRFIGWLRYNLFWDNTPFMNMLFLLEENRNKGLGKILVNYWEDEMKKLGYNKVMTSTSSNEYSQHFYNNLGYKTIGGFNLEYEPYELILYKAI